jgi:hypothetical protein
MKKIKKIDRFAHYFVVKSPKWGIEGYFKTTNEAKEFILRQAQYKNINGWEIEQGKGNSSKKNIN